MRILTVLAAMLLSCGIANAQTVKGDVNQDQKLNAEDITALADSVMKDNQSKRLDLNDDDKVNAADVVTVVNLIQDAEYFYLGTEKPTSENYNTLEGVSTEYESIEDVLKAAKEVSVEKDKTVYVLCPKDWNASGVVAQDQITGVFYGLEKSDASIENHEVYKTTEIIATASTIVLKSLADAKTYFAEKNPNYFYLGTQGPTSENYTRLEGGTTKYETLEKVLEAALTLSIEYNEQGFLLYPSSWDAKELVLQNENNGSFYELKLHALTPHVENVISGYTLLETGEVEGGAVTVLKTKAAAEEYKRSLKPEYFWLGNTKPTKNNFPTLGGKEVPGVVTTYTSLGEAMEKASRVYTAGEWAVVLYPFSWGDLESLIRDELVFLDSANKKYYATVEKTASDFPDYHYYESSDKIGANTTITLSTKTDAEAAGATLYEAPKTPETPVTPVNPDPGPVTPVTPVDPVVVPGQAEYIGGNAITFVITNNCGYEARFSGKAKINVSKNPNSWADYHEIDANFHAPQVGGSWAYNDIIIGPGERKTLTISSTSYVSSVKNGVSYVNGSYANTDFADGSWYFMNSDNGLYVHSIYLYTRIYSRSKGETSGSNHMYVVYPLQNTKLQRGWKYYLNLYWKNPEASLWPDTSGKSYIILGEGKTGL